MGWSDTWYPAALQALGSLRPNGPTSTSTGQALPGLSAIDTIGVIGQVTPGVVSSINTFSARVNGGSALPIIASANLDSEGILDSSTITDVLADNGGFSYRTAVQYLAMWPGYDAVHRAEVDPSGDMVVDQGLASVSPTFEPYGATEPAILAFLRQAIIDWQRLVNASATALSVHAADTTTTMDAQECTEFFDALGALCSDFDALQENPPVDMASALKGALAASLAATANFVGQSTAAIANTVGKTAGGVASGLISGIGITGIAVVGIALYLFVR